MNSQRQYHRSTMLKCVWRKRFRCLISAGSIFLSAMIVTQVAFAAPGELDPKFGNMGRFEQKVGEAMNGHVPL